MIPDIYTGSAVDADQNPTARPPSGFRGRAGVARRDITPPVGIRNRNWGPAATDTSDGVHRPFSLTAMALQADAGDLVVLLAVDGTWWRRVDDHAEFRRSVLRELGLAEHQLLVSLSHTHAGPVLCAADRDLPGGELIPAYLATLRTAAIAAGRQAVRNLAPAMLEWTVGRCQLAANRDLQTGGRPLVGYQPDRIADDTLLVGRLSKPNGTPLATVVNYACHPTTLGWQNTLLSPDYVGALRETVESATDAPCLFLQGASGELAPREQYTGDTSLADRHGTAIGHATLAALSTMPPPGAGWQLTGIVESGAPLAIWTSEPRQLATRLSGTVTEVPIPVQPIPSWSELAAQWSSIDPRSRAERMLRARNLRDGYLDSTTTQVHHPIWTVLIGDAVLIGHPGEAYSDLQVELRRRFPDRAIVVVNLTNGPGFVYLPTADAYRRNAYPAWQTPLAQGALELLIDAATAAVLDLLAIDSRAPGHGQSELGRSSTARAAANRAIGTRNGEQDT